MTSWFRRFAAVGLVATAVDIGLAVVRTGEGAGTNLAAKVTAVLAAAVVRAVAYRFLLFREVRVDQGPPGVLPLAPGPHQSAGIGVSPAADHHVVPGFDEDQ